MPLYTVYLRILSGLFAASGVVLLVLTAVQAARQRVERAAAYLGLTLLAGVVAAGLYYFSRLIS